jgi:outer membrane lipoprotein SlyB
MIKNTFKYFSFLLLSFLLSACSTNDVDNQLNKQQIVESGTVISVKTVNIKPEKINSYGNVGVSVGSGGHSGVYGSVDVGTIGRIFRNASRDKKAQEIIIKKDTGNVVAITQDTKVIFKKGDKVRLLLRNGKARVTHKI